MKRKAYSTDLTDAQWLVIEPLIPKAKPGGRPRTTDMREVLNALWYLLRTGCAWRLLPHDFPAWGTVHYYYWHWRHQGVWQHIHDELRRQTRTAQGREESPSAAIIDSQTVKTTEKGGTGDTMPARRSTVASAILR